MNIVRKDDFNSRKKHLENLTDEELKNYFWDLAHKAVEPMLELAKNNTSPAIERSILLRMGFSSIEAKVLVEKVIDYNLIKKGAGHVVYRYSKLAHLSIRDAGKDLMDDNGWEIVKASFEVKNDK